MYLYAAIAFKIWMAVDCVKRGGEGFWLWIIILAPFGDWVYFVAVKVPELRTGFARRPRKLSSDELRRRYRTTPSLQNRLELATALAGAGEHAEAVEQFRGILAQDPSSLPARFGLARALRDQGELALALDEYRLVLEVDPKYGDHAVALEHAELCWDTGDRERALQELARLGAASQRIDHQIALAQHLSDAGAGERARVVLEAALESYEDSPDYVKRRDRAGAREARRLARALASASASGSR